MTENVTNAELIAALNEYTEACAEHALALAGIKVAPPTIGRDAAKKALLARLGTVLRGIDVLATFAREVSMGAYRPSELPDMAKQALERAGAPSRRSLAEAHKQDQPESSASDTEAAIRDRGTEK